MPTATTASGWSGQARAAFAGSGSTKAWTAALRTTCPASNKAATKAIPRHTQLNGFAPKLMSAVAPLRDHQDLGALAADLSITVAVPVAIGAIAVGSAPRARLGESGAEHMGPRGLEPVERLDRGASAGLSAFDNEQQIAGGGRKQRRVGKADRRRSVDDHDVEALRGFR